MMAMPFITEKDPLEFEVIAEIQAGSKVTVTLNQGQLPAFYRCTHSFWC